MKSEKLLNAIGKIDDRLIADAAEYYVQRKYQGFWAVIAACVCLAVIVTLWQTVFTTSLDPAPTDPYDLWNQAAAFGISGADDPDHISPSVTPQGSTDDYTAPDSSILASAYTTSDTYKTLDELLSYLSKNDYHDSRVDGLKGNNTDIAADGNTVTEGAAAAVYENYAYHIANGKVNITKLGNGNPENVGAIDFAAEYIFLWENRLALVNFQKDILSPDKEPQILPLDGESQICVRLYDLSNPEAPSLQHEFIQAGRLSSCFMNQSRLYLLTADGVCACGYSRLKDMSEYIPKLSQNGEPVVWGEEEICILGEPSSVQYLAAAQLDISNGRIIGKQAFYGDIEKIFYGSQWLAIMTQSRTDASPSRENIYFFDTPDIFVCTGKINPAEMSDIGTAQSDDSSAAYPHICSVTRSGNIYRMIGECPSYKRDAQNGEYKLLAARLLAITTDTAADKTNYEMYEYEADLHTSIDELHWEGARAIISVSSLRPKEFIQENQFLFAEFNDFNICLYGNDLTADHVAGVDGVYEYGNPFGYLESLIPLENRLYVRYNETPDGLDIYDFSNSAQPRCLYQSVGDIPEGCRFDFTWEVYSEDTFGIMVITPKGNGDYRNVSFSWNIYRINSDMEHPYTLLAEFALGEGSAFRNIGFVSFEHNGQHYYITQDSDAATALHW